MKMDLQRQTTLLSKHDTGYYHLHDNKHANNKTNCTTSTIILLLLLLIVSLMQILKNEKNINCELTVNMLKKNKTDKLKKSCICSINLKKNTCTTEKKCLKKFTVHNRQIVSFSAERRLQSSFCFSFWASFLPVDSSSPGSRKKLLDSDGVLDISSVLG